MLDKSILKKKLLSIDGHDYLAYQQLLGSYRFPLFKLIVQKIPKDPYAPPRAGIYRIQLRRDNPGIINQTLTSKVQEIAFCDYLARRFFAKSERISTGSRGNGYSGVITINQPSQVMLERNNVIVTDETIELRCFLGLPGKGRKVDAAIAEQMLLIELSEIVKQTLLSENIDSAVLKKHIEVAEDSEYLREQLNPLGLVAFIANGAIMPRESGTSDKPMLVENAVPFSAPESLSLEIELPNAGLIKGMAIPKGITLIVGGGFHGKSTLLHTLETGIYNHIVGDGREYCVAKMQTAKIRAYNGRYVINSDISAFINHLPLEQDTSAFFTDNASGSTSQAANIVEAIEVGAEVLLMDEDTCAANFMTRDSQMQQLVDKDDEPITTFIDTIRQLYLEKDISTILVLGGIGDYFSVSDRVVQMINYQPVDVTIKAQQIAASSTNKRQVEGQLGPVRVKQRMPIADSINPINQHGKFSINAKQLRRLNFGKYNIDLTDMEQLTELSQTRALGYAIEYAKIYMDNKTSIKEVVDRVSNDIDEQGLDEICESVCGDFARFRNLELALAMNRLRSFKVIQKNQ